MVDQFTVDEDGGRRAIGRSKLSLSGIGAAVIRETTAPDLDGKSWECVISDGSRAVSIEIVGPRLMPSQWAEPVIIEEAVERVAANCAEHRRLFELAGLAPLSLPELYLDGPSGSKGPV